MLRNFLDGLRAYPEAVRIMSKHRLWGYMLVPTIISLILIIVFGSLAFGLADNFSQWLVNIYPWEWGKNALEKVGSVFGGLFVFAIGFILLKHIVMAIASPFMSFLSESIEKKLYGEYMEETQGFNINRMLREMIRGIRIALRNIIREIFFTILLFLLGLIPLFSPFVPFLIFFVQAYYAGFGSMDFTLERHYNVRQSVQFVRQHKGLAVGNGTVFMLLMMTGIGFLVALPLSTVAAATETLDRL